ncbi:MAG: hypothetical protein V4558_00365 [Gemmatimonadota bacterium]
MTTRHSFGALSLLVLLSSAAPIKAQTRDQRLALARWGDSLTHAQDAAALAAFGPVVGAGDKAVRQVRRALYNARRGEVSHDRGALEKALFDFDQASARHRDWPWPDYGLALVFKTLHFEDFPAIGSSGQYPGEAHSEATWRHLRDAIKRDPAMPEARHLALSLMIAAGDRELPATQEDLFNRMLGTPSPEADLQLVFGRVLRARKQFDSSLMAFDRALGVGGDRAQLQLERARSLRSLGDSTAAVAAYWDGAAHPSEIGRRAYRTDLAWILSPDSLGGFDAQSSDSLLPWLTRFWAERDMWSAKTTNGRLAEHLRRWAVAFANFRVSTPWRRTMYTRVEFGYEGLSSCISSYSSFYRQLSRMPPEDPADIRSREPLLDHRGLVYLRHGDPVGRTALVSVTGPTDVGSVGSPVLTYNGSPSYGMSVDIAATRASTASWLYWIEGAWRVLFFRGSKALGTNAPTTLTSFLPLDWIQEWLTVAKMAPEYAPAASKLATYTGMQPVSCLSEVKKAVQKSRRDGTVGISTDSDSPPITHPWNGVLEIFGVGGSPGNDGRALITFALPTTRLQTTPRDSGRVGIDVRFRLSAYNRATGAIVQIDTVRHFAATTAAQANQFLSGLFEVPLTPGAWDVSVLARQETDSSGAYALSRARPIAIGASLALSDVVTGTGNGRILWPTAQGAFPLNPLSAWTPKASLEIYYEIYGLADGTSYRATLELRPADGQKTKSVIIGTTGQSAGLTTHVRRTVGLTQLKPGGYRLIVTVTHGAESATSERPIQIVKP